MSRRSILVKISRGLQQIPPHYLRPLELPFVRVQSNANSEPHLVFLMALPRSGSTLAYQLMVHGFEPLYLSNLSNLFYGLPWVGGKLSSVLCECYKSNFKSQYGFVEGLCGPAEGLKFWSYWTASGLDEVIFESPPQRIVNERLQYFRRALGNLTSSNRPLIAGYLGHALTSKNLRSWFPGAIFVRLHRDPLSNALSILRSRLASGANWFSVRPVECRVDASSNYDIHYEVASQVYWLNRRLDWLMEDEKTIHVSYEGLATDPKKTLEIILKHAHRHGLSLTLRKNLPESFNFNMVSPDLNNDAHKLFNSLSRIQEDFGPLSVKNFR
jgi:hypothetical protein